MARNKRSSKCYEVSKTLGDESDDDFETMTFESIIVGNIGQQEGKGWTDEVHVTVNVELQRNSKMVTKLNAKVDTGAQGNVLPVRLYRQMYPNNIDEAGKPLPGVLKQTNTILTAYGGASPKQYGTLEIPCEYEGKKTIAIFYVTEVHGPAILGLPTVLDLRLLTFNCSIERQNQSDQRDQRPKRGRPAIK